MRKSNIDKVREKKQKKMDPVKLTLEGLTELLIAGDKPILERRLNPTQMACISCPDLFIAYMGAAGVAKTSTGVGAVLLQCLLEPGTRALIGRRDYNEMKDTTMRRFFEMLGRLPPGVMVDRDKSPPMKVWIQPINGEELSEVTFMGLNDVIGSHEYHVIFVDEADEVEEARLEELMARLRAPGPQQRRFIIAFNPPSKTHHLYTMCTGKDARDRVVKEPVFRLFRPVPNENDRNLPEGYHDDLRKRLGPERAMRLADGQWGAVFDGIPVYRDFKRTTHGRRRLVPVPGAPLFRWWDFGYRHPFCIWADQDERGVIRALSEHSVENVEAEMFIRQVQAIGLKRYGVRGYIDFGDIAVRQKKDTGSTLAVLARNGIRMQSNSMSIDTSIDECRRFLRQMYDGEPMFQIDVDECPILSEALGGGYRMDKNGEFPLKDGYYDHPADAWRYGMVGIMRGYSDTSAVFDSVEYREDHPPFHDVSYRPEDDNE